METKKNAQKFIKENPDQEEYICKNLRYLWNVDEADDNSIELSNEWETKKKESE